MQTKKRDLKSNKQQPETAAVTKRVITRPDVLHGYLDYTQINQYLDYLSSRYSHFIKVFTLGRSFEKREVRAIEINWMNANNTELPQQVRARLLQQSPPPAEPTNTTYKGPAVLKGEHARNIVFIEAGAHAREWITVSTALNCIYQLVERNMRNIEILRRLRFVIVPLVNPDGYEYSRNKNRNWRKNRRPHKHGKFVGTDCNRNYDIFWECGTNKIAKNTYKGEKPFSEPETRAMRNILDRLGPNLLFFLSLHSYGQCIMYPWGYSKEPAHYVSELETLANSGRTAIKSYNGRDYRTGSISGLQKHTINGSVVDYVYGVLKTPLALVMELPSRELGFQPPVENVSQIGHESWYGIREMCKRAFGLNAHIDRKTEPHMPTPPLMAPSTRARLEGGKVVSNDVQAKAANKPETNLSTVSNETPVKKTKLKKCKKRNKHFTHASILELQKRANMRQHSTVAQPKLVTELPKPVSTATQTKRKSAKRAGENRSRAYGPMRERPKTTPYIPPSMMCDLPLNVFL